MGIQYVRLKALLQRLLCMYIVHKQSKIASVNSVVRTGASQSDLVHYDREKYNENISDSFIIIFMIFVLNDRISITWILFSFYFFFFPTRKIITNLFV